MRSCMAPTGMYSALAPPDRDLAPDGPWRCAALLGLALGNCHVASAQTSAPPGPSSQAGAGASGAARGARAALANAVSIVARSPGHQPGPFTFTSFSIASGACRGFELDFPESGAPPTAAAPGGQPVHLAAGSFEQLDAHQLRAVTGQPRNGRCRPRAGWRRGWRTAATGHCRRRTGWAASPFPSAHGRSG